MFHNYFFLKRLAAALDNRLKGLHLLESFTQNRDEIILGFGSQKDQLYIKANLDPQIALIDITDDFKRARKNSVDLFSSLIDLSVQKVRPIPYDRSFEIVLEKAHSLIFKMHGSRSNVLHAINGSVYEIFRGVLNQDEALSIDQLSKTKPDKEHFEAVEGNPVKFLPALGKEVRAYLNSKDYNNQTLDEKWILINETIQQIETNPITADLQASIPTLTLLKTPSVALNQFTDPIEALQVFYRAYTKRHYLQITKGKLLKDLEHKIQKTESYLSKTRHKLLEVENQRSYEEIANIIMANLHVFQAGILEANLFDFYTNEELLVKLKPNMTPQRYAENLYRKSKNQKIEVRKLKENIAQREAILQKLQSEKNNIISENDLKAIKGLQKETQHKQTGETIHPYHKHHLAGYEILIGKNSRGNDELTTRVAAKNDLWLHAKDVPGSHVLIRNHLKKTIPSNVLETAAELAAWFSKRKNDALCPVIYTEKKYVRKIKGTPAGTVKVDKEDVIMVEPKNHLIQS